MLDIAYPTGRARVLGGVHKTAVVLRTDMTCSMLALECVERESTRRRQITKAKKLRRRKQKEEEKHPIDPRILKKQKPEHIKLIES